MEFYSFLPQEKALAALNAAGISASGLTASPVESLEDAFIGLTGRY